MLLPSCTPLPLPGRVVAPLAVVPVVKNVPSRRCDPVGRVVVPVVAQAWVAVAFVPIAAPLPLPPRADASPARAIAHTAANTHTIICFVFIFVTSSWVFNFLIMVNPRDVPNKKLFITNYYYSAIFHTPTAFTEKQVQLLHLPERFCTAS
jgi:hypothetical protein